MARFSKAHMLDELRTIFLFEADHILMGAGPAMAEQFIGFGSEQHREYCHCAPERVDLSRFPITGAFERGYDYAFRPSVTNTLGEHEVQDLVTFMLGTPKAGGIQSGGETHAFMTPDGLCQRVVDAVFARWKLEWDESGDGCHTFTARELALLADMTEGAVRNALADKSENGLRAVPGSKNPVVVEHAEAERWLLGRRSFIPFPKAASTDRFLIEKLQNLQTAEGLGQLVHQRLLIECGAIEAAAEKLSWPSFVLSEWIDGNQQFDTERAQALAEILGLEKPLFVGKALEVTLRRDLGRGGE